MSIAILAFSEKNYYELVSAAKLFKNIGIENINAIVIGQNAEATAKNIAKTGIDKVYFYNQQELDVFNPELYARVLEDAIKQTNAKIALIESGNKGKILAGYISALMGAAVIVDVTQIHISNGTINIEKPVYAGKAMATEKINSEKIVIAVKPGAFEPVELSQQECEILQRNIAVEDAKTKLVDFKPKEAGEVSLEDAEVVVAAGRGIKKKEDLGMIKELANTLQGAWGLTRPLAADYGWAPEWIGISGISIRPKLYIAVGISGQPQHTAGIRDSKIIVAINNDSEAPIFKFSDYGIIGDAYIILPELIKKLKELKGG